jgi:DNA-binding transcriptional ArsR family regulator
VTRNADRTDVPSLDDVEAVFEALAHEARRHIVLLLGHLGGELPSGYLAARFQHSWPTTTRHLKVLEAAGVVEVRRGGRSSHYRLNRDRLRRVVGGWLRHVEPVSPDKTWRATGPRSTTGLHARASGPPQGGAARSTRAHDKRSRKPSRSKGHQR